ncbi:MAG: chemotaxis protein CheW [Acidobacteria bacterium]|nr:chemotaxis protein CheW [Acidobacteriota bacterium]
MTEREREGDEPRRETTGRASVGGADDPRDLYVFSAGGRLFAVYAEEVESAAENLRPAPLPFAPPAVLGVVPVRGRMRTALDPLLLLDAHAPPDSDAGAAQTSAPPTPPHDAAGNTARLFVALAGDEQLALACDSAEAPANVRGARLESAPDSLSPVRARVEHEGRAITLLDPSRLFEAAMRGTDRRRRRS